MSQPMGKSAFLSYYQHILPSNQYLNMLEAFSHATPPILRFQPENEEKLKQLWNDAHLPWKTLGWYPYALVWPENIPLKRELPGFRERLIFAMNASSLLPVLALKPNSDDIILDACAAPGGKTMFIHDFLSTFGHLIANDSSSFRRHRMQQLLTAYHKENVEIWGRKAETISDDYPEYFDKILLDSPCSSEKHVFNNPNELSKWESAKVTLLHERQVNLLNSLANSLKPGGRLVYSTCAVTPEENEAVVAEVLTYHAQNQLTLQPFSFVSPGEAGIRGHYHSVFPLDYVKRVVPDVQLLDPMFVAVFEKKPK